MTKLRRLDPQPEDLTTHKGPFVTEGGNPARLICRDCKQECFPLVFLCGEFDEDFACTRLNGKGIVLKHIYAAEEISEPIVLFRAYNTHGACVGTYTDEDDAKITTVGHGCTIKKFVQDTSYGGGV